MPSGVDSLKRSVLPSGCVCFLLLMFNLLPYSFHFLYIEVRSQNWCRFRLHGFSTSHQEAHDARLVLSHWLWAFLHVKLLSHVRFFAASCTVAHQDPLSLEFSRQEYWRALPFPTPGDLLDPGIESVSPESPALAGGFFTIEPTLSLITGLKEWLWKGSWELTQGWCLEMINVPWWSSG